MARMKCPCKGCEERHENCHAECSKYQAWKNENEFYRQLKVDLYTSKLTSSAIRQDRRRREK